MTAFIFGMTYNIGLVVVVRKVWKLLYGNQPMFTKGKGDNND